MFYMPPCIYHIYWLLADNKEGKDWQDTGRFCCILWPGCCVCSGNASVKW